MKDASGAVSTNPTLTLAGVFEQRKRWSSKTIHYSFKQMLFLSGIFLFYCITALCFILSVINIGYGLMAAVLLSFKVIGELFLMVPGTSVFNKKELRLYLIPASFLQLPLVVVAVVLGAFGTFSWKGEDFHRKIRSH